MLSEIGITDDFSHLYQEVMSDYEAMSSYKEALNPSGAQGGPPPIYPWAVSHVEREIANNPEIDPHSANTRLKKLSRVMVLVENKLSLMGLFERKNHCLENTRKGFGSRCNGGFSFLQSSRHSHTVTANDEQLNQSDFATVFSSQLFNALVKTHFENASDHEQFYYNDDNWKALVKYIREDLSSPMIAEGLEDSFEKKMNLFDQRKG
ncbi:MAG: hypothetical protein HAW66_10460 [Shewanella sp.]|nr:hypothetical protein [Shewanella sp.]